MISLKDYLNNTDDLIDGHIHLFNHIEPILKRPFKRCVGFMDLEFDTKEISVIRSYKNYIKNYYTSNDILLATGTKVEDIKYLLENYTNIIKGIGELKCYDMYQDKPVPYKNIEFVEECCKLARQYNVPIYVHWEFNTDEYIKQFESLISKYSDVKIVLCHCGFTNGLNGNILNKICKFMMTYNNLWVDISYNALKFFSINIKQLKLLPKSRIILGTDINNKLFNDNHDTDKEIRNIVDNIKQLSKFIDSNANIKRLFNF